MKTIALALTILAGLDSFAPPAVRSIRDRWTTPSRMTPRDAAAVLARRASGDWIAAAELFEAEKHLRTDGPLSVAPFVLREGLRRRLPRVETVDERPVEWTLPPPVLHWLAVRRTERGLELRGESVEVAATAVSADRALVVVERSTIRQDWSVCEEGLCYWDLEAPTPDAEPVLSLVPDRRIRGSEIRCDGAGLDSPHRERLASAVVELRFADQSPADGTPRRIVCSVPLQRGGTAIRVAYSIADRLARPPSDVAPSAVLHNPTRLSFDPRGGEAATLEPMIAIGSGDPER